jgi:hypothetical protein
MTHLFNFLAERGVTPNGLYILHSIHTKIGFSEYVLPLRTETDKLYNAGMIQQKESDPLHQRELTETGLKLLHDAEKFFIKGKGKSTTHHDEWTPMIEMFRMTFPTGSVGNTTYRTNVRDLYDRFVWFFDNYNYPWELVLAATKEYVKSKTDVYGKPSYMKSAGHFIRKQEIDKTLVCMLADYCDKILEQKQSNGESEGIFKFFQGVEL